MAASQGALPGLAQRRDAAYVECFEAHYPKLAGYAASLAGDTQLGHEVAQESFTRLFAKWSTVRDPRAFVYFVATNLVREHWRRQRTESRAYARVAAAAVETAPPLDTSLRDLVERLPGRQRDVVLLHYYADLPLEEIARLVRRPAGTVKRWLHEGRTALLAALGDRNA